MAFTGRHNSDGRSCLEAPLLSTASSGRSKGAPIRLTECRTPYRAEDRPIGASSLAPHWSARSRRGFASEHLRFLGASPSGERWEPLAVERLLELFGLCCRVALEPGHFTPCNPLVDRFDVVTGEQRWTELGLASGCDT